MRTFEDTAGRRGLVDLRIRLQRRSQRRWARFGHDGEMKVAEAVKVGDAVREPARDVSAQSTLTLTDGRVEQRSDMKCERCCRDVRYDTALVKGGGRRLDR